MQGRIPSFLEAYQKNCSSQLRIASPHHRLLIAYDSEPEILDSGLAHRFRSQKASGTMHAALASGSSQHIIFTMGYLQVRLIDVGPGPGDGPAPLRMVIGSSNKRQ